MNRYKNLRKRRGLTQLEASKILNVDQSTISKWEQDKAIPDIATLIKLADYFNTSIDYIVGRDSELINLKALDKDTSEIIKTVINLNSEQKSQILSIIKILASN